jgi:hypothetical protein
MAKREYLRVLRCWRPGQQCQPGQPPEPRSGTAVERSRPTDHRVRQISRSRVLTEFSTRTGSSSPSGTWSAVRSSACISTEMSIHWPSRLTARRSSWAARCRLIASHLASLLDGRCSRADLELPRPRRLAARYVQGGL